MNRATIFLAGIAATIGFSALWHGPLGAGDRLAARAEAVARRTLDYYEMSMIQVRLAREPMKRTLVLSGPADNFQHRELARVLNDVPGILAVRWDRASKPRETIAGEPLPEGEKQ